MAAERAIVKGMNLPGTGTMARLNLMLLGLLLCAAAIGDEAIQQAIDDHRRPAADRELDPQRKPKEILAFAQLEPGQVVVELGAGGGYTTELAARVVGESGRVFAQAMQPTRTRGGRLPNVIDLEPHLLYELPDKLEESGLQASEADVFLMFFSLHDMYLNERIDKPQLFAVIRRFLKSGGHLVVLDNAAEQGSGTRDTRLLHRIDERFVIDELQAAGFELDGTSAALRNAEDDLSKPWNSWMSPVPKGFQDRFALRFRNP
jgi:predicted methyltransferase